MQVEELYQILQIWQLFLKINEPSEEAIFESSQMEICVADFFQRLEIYLLAFAIKFLIHGLHTWNGNNIRNDTQKI